MALLKSQCENSKEHHKMKMTQKQVVTNSENVGEADKIETHVYIHTTILEGTKHEERIQIEKRGVGKRVHKKIILKSQQSSETEYNWRRVDPSGPGAPTPVRLRPDTIRRDKPLLGCSFF